MIKTLTTTTNNHIQPECMILTDVGCRILINTQHTMGLCKGMAHTRIRSMIEHACIRIGILFYFLCVWLHNINRSHEWNRKFNFPMTCACVTVACDFLVWRVELSSRKHRFIVVIIIIIISHSAPSLITNSLCSRWYLSISNNALRRRPKQHNEFVQQIKTRPSHSE